MKTYFKLKYNLIRALLYLFILPKKGYGVEIGVWKGRNAKMLYYLTRPKELVLIDPYISKLCHAIYQPVASQWEMDRMCDKVYLWTIPKEGVWLWVTPSKRAAINIFECPDWIYIDGNHFDVYNDLTNWYNNVREGGIIMGDDYGNRGYPKVKEDVDRFCKERGLKLHKLHFQYWFKK